MYGQFLLQLPAHTVLEHDLSGALDDGPNFVDFLLEHPFSLYFRRVGATEDRGRQTGIGNFLREILLHAGRTYRLLYRLDFSDKPTRCCDVFYTSGLKGRKCARASDTEPSPSTFQ